MPTQQEIETWFREFGALVSVDSIGISRAEVQEQAGRTGKIAFLTGSTYKQLLGKLHRWDRLSKDDLEPADAQSALDQLVEVLGTAQSWLNKRGGEAKAAEAGRREALIALVQRCMAAEHAAQAVLVDARRRHALAQRLIEAATALEPVVDEAEQWPKDPPALDVLVRLEATVGTLIEISRAPPLDLGDAVDTVQSHLETAGVLLKRGRLYRLGEDAGGRGTPTLNRVAQQELAEAVVHTDGAAPTFLRGNTSPGEIAVRLVIDKSDKSAMKSALDDAAAADVGDSSGEAASLLRFNAYIDAFCQADRVPAAIAGLVASGIEAAGDDENKIQMVAANILILRWLTPFVTVEKKHKEAGKMIQWMANNVVISGKELTLGEPLKPESVQAIENARVRWMTFVNEVVASARLPVMRALQDAQAQFEALAGIVPEGVMEEGPTQNEWSKGASHDDLTAVLDTTRSVASGQARVEGAAFDRSIDEAQDHLRALYPLAVRSKAVLMARAAECEPNEVLPTTTLLEWTEAQLELVRLFAAVEFSTEQVDFVVAYKRGLGNEDRRQELATCFIKAGAEKQVNISAGLRRKVLENIDDDDAWLRAVHASANVVMTDTLSRLRPILQALST
jgi:hypothetical protein